MGLRGTSKAVAGLRGTKKGGEGQNFVGQKFEGKISWDQRTGAIRMEIVEKNVFPWPHNRELTDISWSRGVLEGLATSRRAI